MMRTTVLDRRTLISDFSPDFRPALNLIKAIQRPSGAIPWFADGIWDAWNHVESAMALEAMGERKASDAAYDFLRKTQKSDGSWIGDYGNTAPMIDTLYMSRETEGQFHDTNFIAYCATGIWHRYACRGDRRDLDTFWPMVSRALGFVLDHQSEFGDVSWSSEGRNFGPDDSVRAGNASIRKSLESGVRIAMILGKLQSAREYQAALRKIDQAISEQPDRFDRNGQNRSTFAMDWYYPSMSGCLKGHAATVHIRQHWSDYVHDRFGCRCVTSEPWITVAETAELAITMTGLGARNIARKLVASQMRNTDSDGTFWMGYQFKEDIFWPREKPSWTQAAMILASESLRRGSPTEYVLCHHT